MLRSINRLAGNKRRHPVSAASVQRTQVWKLIQRDVRTSAQKRVPVARAVGRADMVTQKLVIPLKTVREATTQVDKMNTYFRVSAAIETWTRIAVASNLILVPQTIADPVTA